MGASRLVIYECADGTGFNVLMESPGLPDQWHWANRTRNMPNREMAERFAANASDASTVVARRNGRVQDGALPEEWIVPETVVYYAGTRKWRPAPQER